MSDGSSILLVVRMVVSLALVLGLLVLIVRFLQRRQGGVRIRSRGARMPVISILGRQSLSRTTSLTVVRVADQVLVVGVSDTGVRLLSESVSLDWFETDDEDQDEASDSEGSTRAERRQVAALSAPTSPLMRAALRQADNTAQVITSALTRSGRRRE